MSFTTFEFFLFAIINGVHTGFTQTAILETYRLGTAANVTRLIMMITMPSGILIVLPCLCLRLRRAVLAGFLC